MTIRSLENCTRVSIHRVTDFCCARKEEACGFDGGDCQTALEFYFRLNVESCFMLDERFVFEFIQQACELLCDKNVSRCRRFEMMSR